LMRTIAWYREKLAREAGDSRESKAT
jgi:hypothetical protein